MHGSRFRSGMAVAVAIAGAPAAAQTVAPPTQQPTTSAPVAAQAKASGAVEQIMVTANKRRERERDVANSVTAISGAQLELRQQVSIQDLAGQVPGLSVEVDDKSTVRIVLRGVNSGGVGATVASVLDDVPTNATTALNDGATGTPNFDTYDLQRIEVLKGPQSTLYGATAEGGLIKYVTNPPDPTKYSGALEGGLDGTTDGGIGGALKGYANFPLLNGRAALRLTAWNEWTPGYIDNPELGKTNYNSGQQYGWRASLLVNPTTDLTIRLTAERQSLFSNGLDFLQVVGAAKTPTMPPADQLSLVNGLDFNTRLPTPAQNEAAVYYANMNYDLGWSNLTSITSFSLADFKTDNELTSSNLAPGISYSQYLALVGVYPAPPVLAIRQNNDTDKFNQEVRLTSDPGFALFGHRFEWLAGGYFTHETATLLQGVDAFGAAAPGVLLSPPPGSTSIESNLSEWAVFGNADYFLTPAIDLALGGRWSGNAQHSQTIDYPAIFYGSGVKPEIASNDHDALYSVAPRWRASDSTMLYGRIATGYRPGGPNTPVPNHPEVPTFFGPDRTINYEVGLRQDLFDKRVAIDVTGFYITWKNVQVVSILNGFGFNGNAGDAVSKGVEWNLGWSPLDGLRLNAVGSYQDSRLTKDAPGIGGVSGDYLPYVPDVTTGVNADYGWQVNDRFQAYVSGTWNYVGTRYSDFAMAGGANSSHALLPGYHTGSLRAGLDDSHYGIEFYVNNVSDTRGFTNYVNNGGANQTGEATIIQPRTLGMIARVKF